MSMETSDVIVTPRVSKANSGGSYLEWSAISGGAVLSAAITTVMAAFGSAIGLSLVSADTAQSAGLVVVAIATGLWAIWITVVMSAMERMGWWSGPPAHFW